MQVKFWDEDDDSWEDAPDASLMGIENIPGSDPNQKVSEDEDDDDSDWIDMKECGDVEDADLIPVASSFGIGNKAFLS